MNKKEDFRREEMRGKKDWKEGRVRKEGRRGREPPTERGKKDNKQEEVRKYSKKLLNLSTS